MELKRRFIEEWAAGRKPVSELCREFGISRKTGYALWNRFREAGEEVFEERPRRRGRCPHETPAEVRDRLLDLRRAHPRWGPKKLRELLRVEGAQAPALSTIAEILRRQGLSQPQRRRRHGLSASPPLVEALAPNDVWSTDFKGQYYVGTGERCDPLTVLDLSSRFLLACHGYFTCPGKVRQEEVIEVYLELFKRHGLPRYIVSDNGGPFASTGPGGLTRLSVMWIRLGITPLRIDPGKPQQNGRLERLHRTLKAEVASPSARTVAEQVRRHAEFVDEYNTVRPHEALAMATPLSAYRSGPAWNGIFPDPVFPDGAVVRRVTRSSGLGWRGHSYLMPSALNGQDVGLVPVGDGSERALVYLCHFCVGILDYAKHRLEPPPREALFLRPGTTAQGNGLIVVSLATS